MIQRTPRIVSAASTLMALLLPLSAAAQNARPSIQFNGYVDADFVTTFGGGGFADPEHATGLEIDLSTTINFSPRLNAIIYTTMNDGIVPAQGAGRTWDDVNFDGVQINWQYSDKTRVTVGDITSGVGYFNYYANKRTSVVVGEHTLRGAGIAYGALTVATGAANLGMPALDSTGAVAYDSLGRTTPAPTNAWATFVKYDIDLGNGATLTPSAKYVAGIPGATPFNAGLSYDARFGGLTLSADAAVDYYNADYDPGFSVLFEPAWTSGGFSLATTAFYNKKGKNPTVAPTTSPSSPATTLPVDAGEDSRLSPKLLDDLLVYVEPGLTLSNTYAVGLPLEYHDPDLDLAKNEFVAIVPTFYVYPGSGVQWWLWAGVNLYTDSGIDPTYSAGSELIFRF